MSIFNKYRPDSVPIQTRFPLVSRNIITRLVVPLWKTTFPSAEIIFNPLPYVPTRVSWLLDVNIALIEFDDNLLSSSFPNETIFWSVAD